ncbi:MAG TPA: dihydroorotate dehydrogenase [Armatimonadetes bacterium]|nr:dihydroorotate dehydrogenase [Armatimonadota bacterium]
MNLAVQIGTLRLRNPVLTASGTFGYGEEYADLVDLNRLGALVVKGLTLEPCPGNPPPRTVETPAGMLNAIGLQNPGVQVFLREKLPRLREYDVPLVVNINAHSGEEFAQLARILDDTEGIAALEVNISCPNVKRGGLAFSADPRLAYAATQAVRKNTRLPVWVKLSPNVTDIQGLARAVAEAGADAVSLINTLVGMVIDVERRRPVLGNLTGGLSGPAIRPVAVRMVWQVYQAIDLPLIGMGGIVTAQDALEFILAGATAVAVGTAHFVSPRAALEVLDGLTAYCQRQGIEDFRQLIGAAHACA